MNHSSGHQRVGHWTQRLAIFLHANLRLFKSSEHPRLRAWYRFLYFQYKAHFEDPFSRLVETRPDLFQEGHILDVGANIGFNAALFSRVVGRGYRVYAFEPEMENFRQLESLVKEGIGEHGVVAIQSAVGDRVGQVKLWVNPGDTSDHRVITDTFQREAQDTQEVPLTTLDCFVNSLSLPHPIAFVKIDIQGYEGQALRGMTRLLTDNPRAAVAVEYCRPIIEALGFRPEEILTFFRERGYQIYGLTRREGLRLITYDQVDSLTGSRGYLDLLFLNPAASRLTDSIPL